MAKRICHNCGKNMGEKEPFEDKSLTHGLCPTCESEYLKEIELKELLRKLEEPPKR